LGNRWLDDNQLTSLEVGVFDNNTVLDALYVDTKSWKWKSERRAGGNGCTREVNTRRDISFQTMDGGLAALKPCYFPTTAWE
jgi:hypothetical protein